MAKAIDTSVYNSTASVEVGDDEDDFNYQGVVQSAIEEAADYIDTYVAPLRAAATRYYRGEPFGNEEDGRSQIVMTEVRDTVQAILPGLLRIFVSSENVVEFVPTNAATVDLAEQQTDYVNHVFYQDNPGFVTLYQAFKDALVRKTGVLTWWWSDNEKITTAEFSGLTDEQVAVLRADSTIVSMKVSDGEPVIGAQAIAAKQEQIIQLLGPANPICTVQQYRNTLAQMCNLLGFKDASRYFSPIGPAEMQQLAAPKEPAPDPNMMLVQIEGQKVQAGIQRDQIKLQQEQAKIAQEDARERLRMAQQFELDQQKIRTDAMLRLADIEAKYGAQLDLGAYNRELDHIERMHDLNTSADVGRHANDRKAEATMHGNDRKAEAAMHGNSTKAAAATQRQTAEAA